MYTIAFLLFAAQKQIGLPNTDIRALTDEALRLLFLAVSDAPYHEGLSYNQTLQKALPCENWHAQVHLSAVEMRLPQTLAVCSQTFRVAYL
jgi:hypothetical protein